MSFSVLFGIPTAYAQLTPPPECDFAYGEIHFDCFPAYLTVVTTVVISFTVSLSLLLIMVNGFRYMLGGVSDELGGGIESAKKGIRYAIIGLVVSLLIYLIVETIVSNVT